MPSRQGGIKLLDLVFFAVMMTAFLQAVGFDFSHYDDYKVVVENVNLRSGLTAKSLRWALTTTYNSNWIPVSWISHLLDIELFGLHPAGHHLVNLLIHFANTVLLFHVLSVLTGHRRASVFIAASFAVHPQHVEAVAWVSARRDLLMMFFGLAALRAYIGFVRRPDAGRYLLVSILFLCGLMSKSVLVSLPIVLLLLDYWPIGRYRSVSPGALVPDRIRLFRALIVEKAPLFVLSAAVGLLNYFAHRGDMPLESMLGAKEKIFHASGSYVWYLEKTFWPTKLAVFYPYRIGEYSLADACTACIALAGITYCAYVLRRRAPYLLVGWFWFMVTLFPVIGLVQVGGQATADRYTCLAHIGIFLIVAWGAVDLSAKRPKVCALLATAGCAALISLWIACFAQVSRWRNDATLFEHALAVTDGNWVAQNNMGMVHLSRGEFETAVGYFRQAVHNTTLFPEAHNNLGLALSCLGRHKEAAEAFREAIREKPALYSARINLAMALKKIGREDEALMVFLEAYREDPTNLQTRVLLGAAMAQQGENKAAMLLYKGMASPGAEEINMIVDLVLRKTGEISRHKSDPP